MPINPLKEFFKRKKAEVKFARAGPGQKLSSDTPEQASSSKEDSASARRAAAEAAMKRFNKDNTNPAAQRPKFSSTATKPVSAPGTSDPKFSPSRSDVVQGKEHEAPKELPVIDGVPQRSVQLYSTEELAQRTKQPDIDDDFFRLTVEDAKLFKQRYDEERARNEILRTSEMRRREAEAKRPTKNIARLRFKLPNDTVLEASFSGGETLNTVRDWLVTTCKKKSNLDLKNFDMLLGLRPFKARDFDENVKQLGLIPATTITIVLKSSQ